MRIYDPDFNTSDDGSSGNYPNEPAWLQELTNNFKKQHLSKYTHLLANASSSGASSDVNSSSNVAAAPTDAVSTINVVSGATAEPHYHQQLQQANDQQYQQQPVQHEQQYHQEVDTMMSKLTVSNVPNPQYEQPQQQQQQQPTAYAQSQSMSFVPVVSGQQSAPTIDYSVQSHHQQQQQQQHFEQQYVDQSQIQQQQHQQQNQYYQPIQSSDVIIRFFSLIYIY